MLISKCSSLEYCDSFVCCQDFIKNRLAKKAKHRSIVPTLSSLLIGPNEVTEISNNAIPYTEGYPAKLYNMEENLLVNSGRRKIPDEFSSASPVPGKSKRTEDIPIREDENGTRSHYCPLKAELDGERDENENYPDRPAHFDFDINEVLNSCNLASEEIPFLYAQEPPSPESGESENSSDSDSCMKYAPLENQSATNENSPGPSVNPILQLFLPNDKTPSYKRLDEKTMAAWEEDSDDELDYYDPLVKDAELLQKRIIGNESDMEEFEKDSEEENMERNLNLTENEKKKDNDDKNLPLDIKHSSWNWNMTNKNESEEEYPVKHLDTDSNAKGSHYADNEDKNAPTSNLNIQCDKEEKSERNSEDEFTEKELHCADDDGRSEPTSNLNKHYDDKEEKQKPENFSVSDYISKDTYFAVNGGANEPASNLNAKDENKNKQEKPENGSESECIENNLPCADNRENEPISNPNAQDKSRDEEDRHVNNLENNLIAKDHQKNNKQKTKCVPEIDNSSIQSDNKQRDISDNYLAESQTEVTINPESVKYKVNLTTEPMEMNIIKCKRKNERRPDCEDELCSETPDVTDNMHLKEKGIVADDLEKHDGLVFTDLPVLKSVGKSGIFEPVLAEEQKVASKPRNKVMKFFQSFKKKLERNKKA